MSQKFSNTRLDTYRTCGEKYRFKYVEKLEPDVTYTSLHFGKAMDNALNEVLLAKKNKTKIPRKKAHNIFELSMKKWQGQNELVFYKNELPNMDIEEGMEQIAVFQNLMNMGHRMIDLYIDEILPELEEVIDVQIERKIQNEEGDELILIVDFIAKTKDGEKVLFDNKTASKPYAKNSVNTSQQLNLYSEFFPEVDKLGYIVLLKRPEEGKKTWQMIIDPPNEEIRKKAFDEIVASMDAIKDGRFDKNEKSCFSYGRLCEYAALCKHGNSKGLIKRERNEST